MKTVVVTGAGGYIGRHVVPSLVAMGVRVITIDKSDVNFNGIEKSIQADIFSDSLELGQLLDNAPDAILHLAWRNGFMHNDISHIDDLSGHVKFIKKAIDFGVSQITIMGTMHEVGYWEGAIDESTPCNPRSLYGIAKDAFRKTAFVLGDENSINIQWLRAFYIMGEEDRSQSVFGKLLRSAQAGKKTFPFTSGKNKYDFIDVDELGRQISACVLSESETGIINTCSGKPVSLGEKMEHFISDNNLSISLDYGVFPDRPYDSPAVWGDCSRIDSIMQSSRVAR